jgi:SdrD B-like domain
MQLRSRISVIAVTAGALLVLAVAANPLRAAAQSSQAQEAPTLVEVYWQSSKTVPVPGVTNVIVLDSDIARAETAYDSIQFYGLERGETVVLGYIGDKPVSIRVRVVQRPMVVLSPGTLRRLSEMAQGSVSSTVQLADSNGLSTVNVLSGLSWSQLAGSNGRFDFSSQVEDNSFTGGHAFNLRSATAVYHGPSLDVHGFDFNANLVGGEPGRYNGALSFNDYVALRGASVTYRNGNNTYDLFAGTTIPFYYLTLGATRDIAGFSVHRRQSDKLYLFATTSFINAPLDLLGISMGRRNNFMQTAGFSYLPNKRWAMQAEGGISNHGGMGRGGLSYNGRKITTYGSATLSSALFPLNQLASLFSGTTSLLGGVVVKTNERFTESVIYQHTLTSGVAGITTNGSSDSLNPAIWVKMTAKQDVNFNYTYSRSSGGFATEPSTGNRFDTFWHYQFAPQISNSAQVTIGSLQDPLQLNSQDQLTLRDSLSFPIKGGTMMVAAEHDRTSPSLVQKLNSELELLSPALQSLFLADPVSFVNSANLPPEIRAILEAQHPIGTSASAAGQFHLGSRINFSPSFSVARYVATNKGSWTPFFGYGLVYRVTPTFQLTSGLTNIWVLPDRATQVQRTTVFSFGFTKNFRAMPASLSPVHRDRIIEGRVFRDNKVNGVFSAGDRGLPGVEVRLENGEVAITDELGRYKFSGVSGGEHQVLLSLTQFRDPVRMTTRNEVSVDLIRQRIAIADFGVVNFARLTGNVFNDLRFEGKRQPDSKGMQSVRMVLDDGRQKRAITTQSSGDYEVDDLPPGDYTLAIETESLPANYALPNESFKLHVSPVSNVLQDVPVRALRSIAGRVFLRVSMDPSAPPADPGKLKVTGVPSGAAQPQGGKRVGQAGGQAGGAPQTPAASAGEYKLVPMADIQMTAGYGIAKTDAYGNFLLRDLPAGDLTITLVPLRPLPEGMKVPSGSVHMPGEPIQIQGATIVISNPDLVPYLVGKTAAQVRDDALKLESKSASPATPDPASKPAAPLTPPASTERIKPAGGTP